MHYTVTVVQVRQSWLKLPRITNRSIGNTTRCAASIYFSVNIYLINNGHTDIPKKLTRMYHEISTDCVSYNYLFDHTYMQHLHIV